MTRVCDKSMRRRKRCSSHGASLAPRAQRRLPLRAAPRPRGTVFIFTLLILLTIAGATMVVAATMRIERQAAANHEQAVQADIAAQGVIRYVTAKLTEQPGVPLTDGQVTAENAQLGDTRYWLIRPDRNNGGSVVFGVADEAGKLNINTASLDMLVMLPGMTDAGAASIIDWRDPDSEVTEDGAESDYYAIMAEPYQAKNDAFERIEELLWVRDITPELVYGYDRLRNGVAAQSDNEEDDEAMDSTRTLGIAAADDRGVYDMITVHSYEPNTDSTGEPRINVNDADSTALRQWITDQLSAARADGILAVANGQRPFSSVLDFHVKAGLTTEELQLLADKLTASDQQVQRGRINVNTASEEVLRCLPVLEESDVSSIVAMRSLQSSDTNIAWITEAVTDPAKLQAIGPFVTSRSYQYAIDVVVTGPGSRAFKRILAIVDVAVTPARVLAMTDRTGLGWPLAQPLAELRQTAATGSTTTRQGMEGSP